MNYARITDKQLLVETIRRCRVRQIPNISYVAFAAATPAAVIAALDGQIDRKELRSAVNSLIHDGVICVTCRVAKVQAGPPRYSTESGLLRQYHPELPFDSYQHFSPAGIPKPRRSKTMLGSMHLMVKGLYVIADGLPAVVQKLLDQENYVYPV